MGNWECGIKSTADERRWTQIGKVVGKEKVLRFLIVESSVSVKYNVIKRAELMIKKNLISKLIVPALLTTVFAYDLFPPFGFLEADGTVAEITT